MGPCCEQTRAAFEVGLSLDQGQGVYSGWSDVVVSSQLRLCYTCIIDVMFDSTHDMAMRNAAYTSDYELAKDPHIWPSQVSYSVFYEYFGEKLR